jgi:Fic family protein
MTAKILLPARLPIERIDWEALISPVGRSNRALAQFGGILSALPNPALLLAPLTTQEAVLSSRIEGTQATLGDVLKFEAGQTPDQESKGLDIQEILNYRKALCVAERELLKKPFNLNLLKRLHSILLDSVRGRNKDRGEFRRIQNWIGPQGTPIEQAHFVPPGPERVMEYLDNWEKYYHMERPDPLVQLAILHAQFEIIHPFLDGNGRLGRLIIPLFLHEKKILPSPMFYLSSWLERNRREYYSRLRSVSASDGGWSEWIMFFLRAVEEQARANTATAQALILLYDRLKEQILSLTRSQWSVPLLDMMFRQPVFSTAMLNFKRPQPTRAALLNMLRTLQQNGIIKIVTPGSGRRGTVFALAEPVNLSEGKKVF